MWRCWDTKNSDNPEENSKSKATGSFSSKDMMFRADRIDLKSLDLQLEKQLSWIWMKNVDIQRPKEECEIDLSKLDARYNIAKGTYGLFTGVVMVAKMLQVISVSTYISFCFFAESTLIRTGCLELLALGFCKFQTLRPISVKVLDQTKMLGLLKAYRLARFAY